MEPIQILLALAFMGGITGLIVLGMRRSLYFFSRGALGLNGSAEEATSTRQSDNVFRLSADPSSRYARGGLMVMAIFLMLSVIAALSLLVTLVH